MSTNKVRRLNLNILVLTMVLLLTAVHFWLHWDFTVDDAAISFSYARNFAQGYGLGALYPGADRVEGYSNLSWVILLGIGTWVGFDTIMLSKIFGLAFSLGSVILLYLIIRDNLRQKWMILGLVLLPASLTFVFWSASGLENALYAFLILCSVYFLIQEHRYPSRPPFGSGISLILVSITRPEGLLYALGGLIYKLIQLGLTWFNDQGIDRQRQIKNLLIWIAVFLIGYGGFKIWHIWYFAYPWPNPIYAKAGWGSIDLSQVWNNPEGWIYVRGFFRTYGAIYLIPFIALGGLIALRGELQVLVIFALSSLVLPLYTHDWMINYRFVYPFIPFATGLIILAADQLYFWFSGQKNNPIYLRYAALVVGVIFAIVLARSTWANLRLSQRQLECGYDEPWAEARCTGGRNYWSMAEVASMYAELGSYAQRVGLTDPIYLIPDIGATSYTHDYRILDLAGLADIHLARADATQIVKQYLLKEQLPDLIFTHSIWTRRSDLTTLSAIWENYLPIDIRTDRQERVHGTFIRKDLIVSKGETSDLQSSELAPGLHIGGIDAPAIAKPGHDIQIDIYWFASQPQNWVWLQKVDLVNQSGEAIYSSTDQLGYGWYPTTEWRTDEVMRQHLVLPAEIPPGGYTLVVSVIHPDMMSVDNRNTYHYLLIDESKAYEGALELLNQAEVLATSGNYIEALETLSSVLEIYPDNLEIEALSPDYYRGASLQLLDIAMDYYTQGDIQNMLQTIYEYNDLRGRQHATPEWSAFSKQLHSTAEQANITLDWESSYYLYLAATLADPDASWSAKKLEVARRDYLLNRSEAINTNLAGGIVDD